MDWTGGCRTEITYTHGYHPEMNPVQMRFLLHMAGLLPPDASCACELGYGQGLSLNIHAAAGAVCDSIHGSIGPVKWTGTDFNPSQAVFAGRLGAISGASCLADSFHDFCKQSDVSGFDYIALHGIWSWISPEKQRAIVRIIDKKLKPGGVLYISYNCHPGWAAFQPARDLMTLYARRNGATRPKQKAAEAFAFMERLLAAKPAYATPDIIKRVESLKTKDSAYLAHEFFNESWHPSSFADLAATLHQARMTFACSAMPVKAIPLVGFSQEQQAILGEIQDPILKETVLDFIFNTQFRKDYWIKGPNRLGIIQREAILRSTQFVLTADKGAITRQVKTSLGTITISETAVQTVQAVLGDGRVHHLAELLQKAASIGQPGSADLPMENLASLAQVMCVLLAAGQVACAQSEAAVASARNSCDRLNAALEELALQDGKVAFLASPVTGGGVAVARFEMLFLLALRKGFETAQAMASFVRDCLNDAKQQILRDNQPITDQAAMLEYLENEANTFVTKRLPLLKNLMVA